MFLNPFMLAAIGAAVLPLVLHFLSRSRSRTVDWSAMMFLAPAQSPQPYSQRLRQWTLLVVRMGIIVLLALALARPALRPRGTSGSALAGAPTSAAIVLDVSGSMDYDENGQSRMDQARDVVLQLLSSLNRGDQVSLILAGAAQTDADLQPTGDFQSIASRLWAIKPQYTRANMAAALDRAADVLQRQSGTNRVLYIVCDRQAVSWREATSGFAKAWNTRWQQGGPPRMLLFPVGSANADNVAIASLSLSNPPAIRDEPADVQVTLHNYGSIPCPALPLVITVNRQRISTTVTLAAGATVAVNLPIHLSEAGSQILSAAIQSGSLTLDNHLDWAIDVIDPVRVLIVTGDDPSNSNTSAALLRLALAPFAAAGRKGFDPAQVQVLPEQQWTGSDINDDQVIVLANVQQIISPQARALERFVYNGGGLLISPGDLCRIDNYNQTLARDASILPAQLQPPTPSDNSAATSLLGLDLNHPLFRFLHGQPQPIPPATIARYFPTQPHLGDAAILASYLNGSPFLIESSLGRGRILLCTTNLDATWSTLPLTNFYLPLVQSAVRYLADGNSPDRNLTPGQPILASIPEPIDNRSVSLQFPDGQRLPLTPQHFDGRAQLSYLPDQMPGIYRIRYRAAGKEHILHYVLAPDHEESDLTPLDEDHWRQIEQTIGLRRVEPDPAAIAAAVAQAPQGRELWGPLLAAVLALAALELLLARHWSAAPGHTAVGES